MPLNAIIRYVIAGEFTRDYVILPNQRVLENIPGGDALYASIGLNLWDDQIGIISCVSQDYPQEWLTDLQLNGISIEGIQRSKINFEQRSFIAYPDLNTKRKTQPISHYARTNQPFPKELLGYRQDDHQQSQTKIHLKDIPQAYFDASTAHICPMPMETQQALIYMLTHENVSSISLRPHSSYMEPSHWDATHELFKNVSTLIISENKIRTFFRNRLEDLNKMITHLADNGSDVVIILLANQSQLVYDRLVNKCWQIPAYPFSRPINPTGTRAAFAGGFLGGFRQSYSTLEAALMGNISSSIILESKKPIDAYDFLPALKQERLHVLRNLAKEVNC